ncbi:site-specific integrase [Listeria innocua]|uniref:site-specific integrase n=1 Tax=Listeria TaxID=1637 RepID=UPI00103B68E5|nr:MULTISPECIES: tyrosine-type recombinase/integrase [Listeria]EAA0094071.1 site-specific integrase [Listeria innocua]EAC4268970.1 site-specific integrase [Listeria innocua]EAC6252839.1 site-specific integrase [Listeria monocytogenes]EAD4137646.1 site-specific integrase [Listeria monocytogenes]EAF2586294.1 site-specific integrase [Listeria monocytogenes]
MGKPTNIYKDKKTNKWFYRAYLGKDENGKKIQKTKRGFATQREAKQAYDKCMYTHSYLKPVSLVSNITFEEFYKVRFVRWYEKQVKRQTYENAQFIFEKKLSYFYKMRLRDIQGQDIEEWMYELSQTATRHSRGKDEIATLSKSYINRIFGHLKIVLNRAVKEGLIERNPVEAVSLFPKENKKVEFWEVEEFKQVMAIIPNHSIQSQHRKIMYEMLFYTGVRIGELQALTWENVNFEKNQITIEQTLIYQTKNDWYLSTPKSNKAYRTIGIGSNLSTKLAQWKKLQEMVGNFEYMAQLDGTFTPPYSFANWLKDYAKQAGIKPIKLHSLRHSHVALLVEKNIQPLMIQERLGHANIQITLGTYGHLYAKADDRVVEAIDTLFG